MRIDTRNAVIATAIALVLFGTAAWAFGASHDLLFLACAFLGCPAFVIAGEEWDERAKAITSERLAAMAAHPAGKGRLLA